MLRSLKACQGNYTLCLMPKQIRKIFLVNNNARGTLNFYGLHEKRMCEINLGYL